MATSGLDVIGPLAFVIVLELARLARDIPLVGHAGETDRLDYGVENGPAGRVVSLVADTVEFSGRLVAVGGFHVVFTLTELVLYGSILIVYLTSGSLAGEELTEAGTSVGVVVFLGLLWMLLPVIVVDRYDDLAKEGIRPYSVDVHIATTILYFVLIVAVAEGQAALAPRRPDLAEWLRSGGIGIGTGLMYAKSNLYRRHLRREIDHLGGPREDEAERPRTAVADGEGSNDGTGGEGSNDGTGGEGSDDRGR